MNSFSATLMLFMMICAASCVFVEKCRTLANMVCAIVMLLSMIDTMYSHLLPPLFLTLLLGMTGIWAAMSTWANKMQYSHFFAIHRLLSAFLMGWLLLRHTVTIPNHAQHHTHHSEQTHSILSLASSTSILLLVTGLIISFIAIRHLQRTKPHRKSEQFAAVEPALMGLSLVLMAI